MSPKYRTAHAPSSARRAAMVVSQARQASTRGHTRSALFGPEGAWTRYGTMLCPPTPSGDFEFAAS
jgi:hypothetical protein